MANKPPKIHRGGKESGGTKNAKATNTKGAKLK